MRLTNYLFRSATTAGITLGAIMAFKHFPEMKDEMTNLFGKTDLINQMKEKKEPQKMMTRNLSPEVMEIKDEVTQLKHKLDNLVTMN